MSMRHQHDKVNILLLDHVVKRCRDVVAGDQLNLRFHSLQG